MRASSGAAAEVGRGFSGAQAASLPSLEAPSTYAPSTPLAQVGALASRVPRAAAAPVQDVIGRVQQSSAGASGALRGLGVPEGVADVAGFGAGVLNTPGAVFGSSLERAATQAGVPGAELQGDIAETLTPFPGTRLGALTRARTAGLVAGPAIGAGVGAATAPEDDRFGGAARGAAMGLAVGPDVADLAVGASRLPGAVRGLPGRFGTAPDAGLGAVAGLGRRAITGHPSGARFGIEGAIEDDIEGQVARRITDPPEVVRTIQGAPGSLNNTALRGTPRTFSPYEPPPDVAARTRARLAPVGVDELVNTRLAGAERAASGNQRQVQRTVRSADTLYDYLSQMADDYEGYRDFYPDFGRFYRSIAEPAGDQAEGVFNELSALWAATAAQTAPHDNLTKTLTASLAARHYQRVVGHLPNTGEIHQLLFNGKLYDGTVYKGGGNNWETVAPGRFVGDAPEYQLKGAARKLTREDAKKIAETWEKGTIAIPSNFKLTAFNLLNALAARSRYSPFSVIDTHMFRLFGYANPGDAGGSPEASRFVQATIARLADEKGWSPHQIQSALWYGAKNEVAPPNALGTRFSDTLPLSAETFGLPEGTVVDDGTLAYSVEKNRALIDQFMREAAPQGPINEKAAEATVVFPGKASARGRPEFRLDLPAQERAETWMENRGYTFTTPVSDAALRALDYDPSTGTLGALAERNIPARVVQHPDGTMAVQLYTQSDAAAEEAAGVVGRAPGMATEPLRPIRPLLDAEGAEATGRVFQADKADGGRWTAEELAAARQAGVPGDLSPDGLSLVVRADDLGADVDAPALQRALEDAGAPPLAVEAVPVRAPALRPGAPGGRGDVFGIRLGQGQRAYHGTGAAYDRPDPGRFSPDGLYGPGYYKTVDPRVASSYAGTGPGANVRPVDVPAGARYLDSEQPLPPEDVESVARALDETGGDSDAFREELALTPGTGQDAYEALRLTFGWSKARVNELLASAGFDGVTHEGGHIMPIMDDATGAPIEHRVFVTFPEALPKLRNAVSGSAGGIAAGGTNGADSTLQQALAMIQPYGAARTAGERAFDVTGGTLGGVAGAATAEEDATWQERAGRFASGAVAGSLVGPTARGGLGLLARSGDDVLGAKHGARARTTRRAPPGPAPGTVNLGDIPTILGSVPLMAPSSLGANFTSGMARSLERVLGQAFELRPVDAAVDLANMLKEVPGAGSRLWANTRRGPTEGAQGAMGAPVKGDLSTRGGLAPGLLTSGVRVNAATDQFWRDINEAGAGAVAQRRGLSDQAAKQHATRAGDFATFTGTNSIVAKSLQKMKNQLHDPKASLGDKAAAWFVTSTAPYIMMPERLLRATVLAPAEQAYGFAAALKRGDRGAAREAAGRFGASMGVMGVLYAMYQNGQLTGDPPQDANERRRREAQGVEWNTITLPNGTKVPSRYFGSVGMQASLVASVADAAKRAEAKAPGDYGYIWEQRANELAGWALDNSYLSDTADFLTAVGERRFADAGRGLLAGQPSRAIPLAPGLLNAADPYEREPGNFPEHGGRAHRAALPGAHPHRPRHRGRPAPARVGPLPLLRGAGRRADPGGDRAGPPGTAAAGARAHRGVRGRQADPRAAAQGAARLRVGDRAGPARGDRQPLLPGGGRRGQEEATGSGAAGGGDPGGHRGRRAGRPLPPERGRAGVASRAQVRGGRGDAGRDPPAERGDRSGQGGAGGGQEAGGRGPRPLGAQQPGAGRSGRDEAPQHPLPHPR